MLAANSPPPASSASAPVAKPVEIPPVSGSDDADGLALAVGLGLGEAVADAVGLALAVAVALGVDEAVGVAVPPMALESDTGTHSPLARGTHMCGHPVFGLTLGGGVQLSERPSCAHAIGTNISTPSMDSPISSSTFLTVPPPCLFSPSPGEPLHLPLARACMIGTSRSAS